MNGIGNIKGYAVVNTLDGKTLQIVPTRETARNLRRYVYGKGNTKIVKLQGVEVIR